MRFVRLEDSFHDSALAQNVPKPCDYHRIQYVDLQVVFVSHVEAIERYSLAEADTRDVLGVLIEAIPSVADRERLID